jgi:hypothetical protein
MGGRRNEQSKRRCPHGNEYRNARSIGIHEPSVALRVSMTTFVRHHIKYKSIHGEEVVVIMEKGEHYALHRRLRLEGKCNIPRKMLHTISNMERDPDKQRRYALIHPDRVRESNRRCKKKFYDEHIEYERERSRKYRAIKKIMGLRPDVISFAMTPD